MRYVIDFFKNWISLFALFVVLGLVVLLVASIINLFSAPVTLPFVAGGYLTFTWFGMLISLLLSFFIAIGLSVNENSAPTRGIDESQNENTNEPIKTAEDRKPIVNNSNNLSWDRELEEMIGLQSVKSEIRRLRAYMWAQNERKKKGLETSLPSLHMVFLGNPGTGKTTVARIIGKMYKELGILEKGHVIETDRSGLVAGYIGQTAIKTKDIIEKARGGVLFIDEAYSLSKQDNDFGVEAIEVLLKYMEDYRSELAVIVAGYPNEMGRFISSNPGLESRMRRHIHFPNYTSSEMVAIFKYYCTKSNYQAETNILTKLEKHFYKKLQNPPKNFANAREVRNLFEETTENLALRVEKKFIKTKGDFQVIENSDLPEVLT